MIITAKPCGICGDDEPHIQYDVEMMHFRGTCIRESICEACKNVMIQEGMRIHFVGLNQDEEKLARWTP